MAKRHLPHVVVAADWSVDEKKRWMVRAELGSNKRYLVFSPEPVGEISALIARIERCLPKEGTALLGFDFPIGLPRSYAEKVGLSAWRQALRLFGSSDWNHFYELSDRPSLRQPFFPLSKQKSGKLKTQLAETLGYRNLDELLRRCDKKTQSRPKAECLFFTLGVKQVGAGTIVGWRDVLAPAMDMIRFWPFDGDLNNLLCEPGIAVAEIYPGEAYTHLDISRWVYASPGYISATAMPGSHSRLLRSPSNGQKRIMSIAGAKTSRQPTMVPAPTCLTPSVKKRHSALGRLWVFLSHRRSSSSRFL